MEERRKLIRRQADRELIQRYNALLQRVQQLEAMLKGEENHELRHKKRRIIRHVCHIRIGMPVGYMSDRDDTWHIDHLNIKGKLLDLSSDGCAIFTHQQFNIDQQLNVIIEVSGGRLIRTVGSVRWTKHIPEKGGYASGVKFIKVNKDDINTLNCFLDELDRTVGL
ncbi:MAG: PilZ domain-containing protein [Candidatus Hydrogenedentes bacterium]|nr:PilZ domain-containing protein [Candidatus Hydrogenedentota bacterium]